MSVKIKYILPATMLLLTTAAVAVSPVGVPGVTKVVSEIKSEERRLENAKSNLQVIETGLMNAVREFNEGRTFDIYYGDVDKIVQLLSKLSGIEVSAVTIVDPTNNFSDVRLYTSGDTHNAVRLDLFVTDIQVAVSVIEKLQLPVYSVTAEFPSKLSVTFLTGGEL